MTQIDPDFQFLKWCSRSTRKGEGLRAIDFCFRVLVCSYVRPSPEHQRL